VEVRVQRHIPARETTPITRLVGGCVDPEPEATESLAPAAIPTPDVPARSLITVLSRSSIIRGICRI